MTHKNHVRKDTNPTLMGREKVRDRSCYVFAFLFFLPMQHAGSYPLTRDETCAFCVGSLES